MSDKITKRCLVCKNIFEPCSTCHQVGGWRTVVCCPEHYAFNLHNMLYERHKITKEQAKKELQLAIDTYGMINFNDNVIKIVDEILSEQATEIIEEIPKKTTRKKSKL